MASTTFVINDSSTGGNNPVVQVTITENPDGTLTFRLTQLVAAGNYLGDLRGLFFDLADESLLGSLSVANTTKTLANGAAVAVSQPAWVSGNDNVKSAGSSSNNMNGLLGSNGGYDFGIEIGSEGVGKNGDDVRAFSFMLDSSSRNLTLADFASVDFGVRITSVGRDVDGNGTIDTSRNGSSKIRETSPAVVNQNHAPVANDDSGAVDEDATLTGASVLGNDTDADGDALTAVLISGPANGSLTLNPNGTYTYTPNLNFNGADSFTYRASDGTTQSNIATVSITVAAVNDAPVAGDDGAATDEDTPVTTGNVLANDTDVDNTLSGSSITGFTQGAHGSVVYNGDGTFTYTPDANFTGTDSFTYTVSDGSLSDTATVNIGVGAVNDAPIIDAPPGSDTGAVQEDGVQTATGQLSATDVDGDPLQWSVISATTDDASADYEFAIDSLRVTRNGSIFFLDTFTDGLAPPAAPNMFNGNATAYGTGGAFGETNGRAVLDGLLAGPTGGVGTDTPFVGHFATLQTNTNSADLTSGLKIDDDIVLEGRFDLALPQKARENYGIRLTDNAAVPGDDSINLKVRRDGVGQVIVELEEADFVADTVTPIDQVVLAPAAGDDQIVLRLTHDASEPGVVHAAFDLLSAGVVTSTYEFAGTGRIFGTETPGDPSDDENWTRAMFRASAPAEYDAVHGSLTVDASGAWAYTLDNASPRVQALAQGETVIDTFVVQVADGLGGTDTQTVTIDVAGMNDAPVIGVPMHNNQGSVAEDGAQTATGRLSAADVDHGAVLTWSVASGASTKPLSAGYHVELDALIVTKNGSDFFLDEFSDGTPPPSAPNLLTAPPTPVSYGVGGTFSEQNGRALFDGARGSLGLGIGMDEPLVTSSATLLTNINPADLERGLKIDDDFSAAAIFDISSPAEIGEFYGIALSDRDTGTPGAPQRPGNDRLYLLVHRDEDGVVRVQMQERDAVADEVTVLGSMLFQPLPGEEQIGLELSHDADSPGVVHARFAFITNDVIVREFSFTETGHIFGRGNTDPDDDENWTRVQLIAAGPADTLPASGAVHGAFDVNAANGQWTYTLDNSAPHVQALAQGQRVIDTVQLRVTDEFGASDTQDVRVEVVGRNDPPVIQPAPGVALLNEEAPTATGVAAFTDVDLTDGHTVTSSFLWSTFDGGGTPASIMGSLEAAFSATLIDSATGDGQGQYSWNFALDPADLQFFASGEILRLQYQVTVKDTFGAMAHQNVSIDVAGLDDVPVLEPDPNVPYDFVELAGATGSATPHAVAGTMQFSDVDLSDTHHAVFALDESSIEYVEADGVTPAGTLPPVVVSALESSFALTGFHDSTNSGDGSLDWSFSAADSTFDFLSEGQRLSFSAHAQVFGNEGVSNSDAHPISISVIGTNDAPVATNLGAPETYAEDTPLDLTDIVVSDVDSDNVTVALTLSTHAAGSLSTGTAGGVTSTYDPDAGVWSASGPVGDVNALLAGVTFTPAPDFDDDFTIATSVSDGEASTVTGVKLMTAIAFNDPPAATNLDAAETYTEDTPLDLTDIVVSDVDSENVTATLRLLNPAVGSLSTASSGTVTSTFDAGTGVWSASGALADVNALLAGVTFVPAPNFNAGFTIETSVSDGVAPALTGAKSVTGVPVNDPPTATNLDAPETYAEDTPLDLTNIVVSDVDSPMVTATLTLSNPAAGTLSTGNSGPAISTYDAGTGTWTASGPVADVNALLSSVTFTPAADYNGDISIAASVSDGEAPPLTGVKPVTGVAANDAPVAAADTLAAIEDTPVVYAASDLLGNDSDVDGDTLSISSVTSGAGGTATLNGDGTVTFAPNANFNGAADFTYTATDGSLESNTATVTVNVAPVNDAPVAVADAYSTGEDTPLAISAAAGVLANDSDPNDTPPNALSATLIDDVQHGTLTLDADGSFSYTPDANYHGSDGFTYRIGDDGGTANGGADTGNTVTVSIAIAAVADLAAADDSFSTNEDTSLHASVAGNDTTTSGGTLSYAKASDPANGAVIVDANGDFHYTPDANFHGSDSFTYTVTDAASGESSTQTASITVGSVNDAPAAVADSYATDEDTPLGVNAALGVLANDADPNDIPPNTLSATLVDDVQHGDLTLNADGSFSYTPDADFNGTDSFTYEVADDGGTANGGDDTGNTVTVTLTIDAANDAPVAADDTLAATEDTPVTYAAADFLGNDTDIDGDTLSIASVTSGAGGTATLNGDGTVTFTPNANFNGAADFTYTASDNTAASNVATATVNVAPVNDAPTITVPGSSAEFTGADFIVNSTGSGMQVSPDVAAQPNGRFVATWFSNDGGDGAGTFLVRARLFNADGTPAAPDFVANTTAAGDQDRPSVSALSDGRFLVAWDSTDAGVSNFLIRGRAFDASGTPLGSDFVINTTSMVYNNAAGVNVLALPNDTYFVSWYTAPNGGDGSGAAVRGRFVDAAGNPLASDFVVNTTTANSQLAPKAALLADGAHFVVSWWDTNSSIGGTGLGSHARILDLNGNGGADFQLNTTTTGVPGMPAVAGLADGRFVAAWNYTPDGGATFDVRARLFNADGTPATGELIVSSPGHGGGGAAQVAALPAGGFTVTWSSNDGGDGSGSLVRARLFDADGNALGGDFVVDSTTAGNQDAVNVTTLTDGRLLYIWESADGGDGDGLTIRARSMANGASTPEDTPLTITGISVADIDAAANGIVLTLAVEHGTLALVSGAGVSVDGAGTALLTVTGAQAAINTALTSGVTYSPDANYNGADTLTASVNDQGHTGSGGPLSASDTLAIVVTAVNDAPLANDDTLAATEDTPVTYTAAQILGNDTDADGDTLSIAAVTSGAGGTATLNGDGTVTFTPGANFNGAADFTYTATDGSATSNVATATVNVAPVNDAPVALNNGYSTHEDTALAVAAPGVLGNDSDIDGDTLTASLVSGPSHGTLTLGADGSFTYTPAANYFGPDSFTYRALDGTTNSNTATVSITVLGVNDGPTANIDGPTTPEDTPVTIDVVANDTDPEGDPLTITAVSGINHGTYQIVDNKIEFTPDADFFGNEFFSYTISDGNGGSDTASVVLAVTRVNDPPIANPDTAIVAEDSAGNVINVLANDTEGPANESAQTLTVVAASALHGAVTINANGTISYTPDADYTGPDTISYTIEDDGFTGSTADPLQASSTVSVTVADANDAPVNTVPGAQTVDEDTNLTIAGISVGDLEATSLQVTLEALHGVLTLSSTSGLSFSDGNGHADATMTFSGTTANVNAALDGVVYRGNSNFFGSDTITLTTSDLGAFGAGGALTDTDTIGVTVNPANDAPTFGGTLDGAPTYTEHEAAVVLDSNVQVLDVDLTAQHYAGASLTLARHNGAHAQDVFSGSGLLGSLAQGGLLVYDGVTVGTVTQNSGGTLALAFDAGATQARVDGVLQSIAYSNSSHVPPPSVRINWTFSDGNTGAQGSGPALTALGSTTVTIIDVPDIYLWSQLVDGQVIGFDAAQDTLRFDDLAISAADVAVGESPLTFSHGGKTVTVNMNVASITTTNVTFDDGSELLVGDNTTATAADAGSNTITAGGTDDHLRGLAGSDSLTGGDGGDWLDGGAGNDTANGGNGGDTIQVETFGAASDAAHGGSGSDRLIANVAGAGSTNFATSGFTGTLAAGYSGTYSNALTSVTFTGIEHFTVTTGIGLDSITTGDGDDAVSTGGNADSISVGAGLFKVDGGDGTDSLSANLSAVTTDLDIDLAANSYSGPAGTSVTNIERLVNFIAGSGNDRLITQTANLADSMDGGAGDDELGVGRGVDSVSGGSGSDRLIANYVLAGSTNFATSGFTGTLAAGYGGTYSNALNSVTFTGIEHFTVTTTQGADSIITGDGDDVVSTGSNNDSISVGAGLFNVDGGADTDSLGANLSAVTTDLDIDLVANSYSGPAGTSVTNIERLVNFISGAGNDRLITQTISAADSMDAGAGNDELGVGGGADSVAGGSGSDRLIVNYAVLGSSFSTSGFTGTLATGHSGTYANIVGTSVGFSGIEHFTVTTGGGFDSITTGEGDDVVSTRAGNDTVNAGAGNDAVTGGTGNDNLSGGAGDDTFTYNVGDGVGNPDDGVDTVNGGEGSEVAGDLQTVNGSAAAETYNINPVSATQLGINITSGSPAIAAATLANSELILTNVEHIVVNTNGGGDTVIVTGDLGDTGVSSTTLTINGGSGNDTLNASALADNDGDPTGRVRVVMNGGGGDDILSGGDGDDLLTGGEGTDSLDGNGGDDTYAYTQLADLSPGVGYTGGALLYENIAFNDAGSSDSLDFSAIAGLTFIGAAAFGATGQAELRYVLEPATTAVLIDADGDGSVDQYLRLSIRTDLVETAPGSRILVAGVPNSPPVAFDDFYDTTESSNVFPVSLVVDAPGVLGAPMGPGADFDADGDALTASLVSGPANGTLAFDAGGGFTYTPDPYFVGDDSFVYRAFDGAAYSADTTVHIEVKLPPIVSVGTDDHYQMQNLYADLSRADPIPYERMAHSFKLATSDGRIVFVSGADMTYDATTNAVTGGTVHGIHYGLPLPPSFLDPMITILGDAGADPAFAVSAVAFIDALQDYANSSGADAAGLDAIFQTIRYSEVGTGSGSNDGLVGGPFDDYFAGAAGSDTIVGGAGDDLIIGGADSGDVMTGGPGADVFQFGHADGVDDILDFSGVIGGDGDVLDLRALFGPLDFQTDIVDTATYDGTDTTLNINALGNALTIAMRNFDIADLQPADVLMPIT